MKLAGVAVRLDRLSQHVANRVAAVKPRRAGPVAATALVAAAIVYGVVQGGHVPPMLESIADARDAAANSAGFRIATFALTGRQRLTETDVFTAAGITERTSLLFLNVDAVRRKLESSPWIVQATVRKFYPGHLEIAVTERDPFAVWQVDGKLWVIAEDGTVLEPWGARKMEPLPLVVGAGAAPRARTILAMLDRHPSLRGEVRASVLVAERRWNLKLKNGLDVRLPEQEIGEALATLVALEQEKKLLSRDLTAIDLRLPGRVSVRLSDDAAKAREEAAKARKKQPQRRGGNA